jgi:hypothetical protein
MLAELARKEEAAEVIWRGTRYRVYKCEVSEGGIYEQIKIYCEPMAGHGLTVAAQPSVQEQIMEALRLAPGGMTARQIGEKVECTRQWVFTSLAAMVRAKQVSKDGAVYRALVCVS